MRKHFPTKIRLKGNQDVASAFIRDAKIELLRTDELRKKMDVPIYGRTIELNEHIWIEVQISKEQRIVTIHADVPVEKADEFLEEHVKDEEERCQPAFLVYRNEKEDYAANPEDVVYPESDGHKITWRNGRWQLDADADKACGNAAWYHVRDLYGKYYTQAHLKECDLISWDGNHGGAFMSTEDQLQYTGAPNRFRGIAIYVGGKSYLMSGVSDEILAAAYLPHRGDKKDYFYAVCYDRYGSNFSYRGEKIYVRRADRDPSLFGPDLGTRTTTLTITAAELAAAAGGTNTVSFPRPGFCGYISPEGIATIGMELEYPMTTSGHPDPGLSSRGYVFNDTTYVVASTVSQSNKFLTLLKINLLDGTWEVETPAKNKTITPQLQNDNKEIWVDTPVVKLAKYGGGDNLFPGTGTPGSCTPGQNDLIRLVSDDVDNRSGHFEAKLPGEQVIRNPSVNTYHLNGQRSGVVVPVAVYGGCDDLYTYSVRIEDTPQELTGKGTATPNIVPNSNYNPDLIASIISYPAYSHEYTLEVGGFSHKQTLIVTNSAGEELWSLPTVEIEQTSTNASHYRTKIRSQKTTGYDTDDEDNTTAWDTYSEASQTASLSATLTDTDADGVMKHTSNAGTVESTVIQRCPIFMHPMIPDLYTYLERRMYRGGFNSSGTEVSISVSYHVFHEGEDTQMWEAARAVPFSPQYEGKIGGITGFYLFGSGNITPEPSAGSWPTGHDYSRRLYAAMDPSIERGYGFFRQSILFPFSSAEIWLPRFSTMLTNDPGRIGSGRAFVRHLRELEPPDEPQEYWRRHCAVHHRGFGSDLNAYPYLVYLQHPILNPNWVDIADSSFSFGWSQITDSEFGSLAFMEPQDQASEVSANYYSNVLSLNQLKRLTKETGNVPCDFGVI